jgi:hypothetical protein
MDSIFGVVFTHACHLFLFHEGFNELLVIFSPFPNWQLFDVNSSLVLGIHLDDAFHIIVSVIFACDFS